jgi:hypothetical protein
VNREEQDLLAGLPEQVEQAGTPLDEITPWVDENIPSRV